MNPNQHDFSLSLFEAPPLPVSLVRQISCWWQERRLERDPQAETDLPVVDMQPWFRNLPEQMRAMLSTPKAVPVRYRSRHPPVPDIWQDYLPNPYSWANSLLAHAAVLTALLLPFAMNSWIKPAPLPTKLFDYTKLTLTLPYVHKSGSADKPHGGGGGGQRVPMPPSKGALPMFSHTQFTPPMVVIPKTAALPMQATLIGPPDLVLPAMKLDLPFGDPNGVAGPPSPGPGTGGGIGTGKGPGVGSGDGPGTGPGSDGGWGGDRYRPGFDGVTNPIAIFSPEPSYSEEARKAKFGGTVRLWIVVDAQGVVHDVRITKPLGMGLDEQAVRTVNTWRFQPATRNGVPVPVQVEVEVTFRLF